MFVNRREVGTGSMRKLRNDFILCRLSQVVLKKSTPGGLKGEGPIALREVDNCVHKCSRNTLRDDSTLGS